MSLGAWGDEGNIAISTLSLGGFLTDGQRDQAREKLARRILRDLIPIRSRAAHPEQEEGTK